MSPQDELDLLRLRRKRAMAMTQQGSATTPEKPRDLAGEHEKNLEAQGLTMLEGKDTPMGGRQVVQMPSDLMGQAKAFLGAPGRMVGGMVDVAKDIGRMDEPLDTKLLRYGESAIKGIGERAGKLAYGNPVEQAGVVGDITTGMALNSLPVLKQAGRELAPSLSRAGEEITAKRLQQGTNQIMAALHPSVRTSKALQNTQGDFFQYATKTGRDIMDADSAASVFKDATDDFYKTNYQPLIHEIEQLDPSITKRLERRTELNDTLGRLGYYDKHPIVQSAARTAPQTGALLDEVEAIRKSVNKTVDTLTPTNAGAANILRKYADMKQVSDMTRIKAERIDLAKKIKAGEQPTMGERLMDVGKDVAVSAGGAAVGGAIGHVVGGPAGGHIGAAIGTIANPKLIKQMANIKGLKPDPDSLFARGFENWKKGSGAAAQPIPITRKQLPTPDDLLQNAGGKIRYGGPSPNALAPQEPVRGSYFEQNPSPLQPEVVEASRAQAAQGPQRLFNEAAQTSTADIEQILRDRGFVVIPPEGAGQPNIPPPAPQQFPLARSRPGERGSIRIGGGPEENPLSPKPPEEEWFSGYSPKFQQRRIEAQQRLQSPEYQQKLKAIGLTDDEIRINSTPRSQLNEVEQAVKRDVHKRIMQHNLGEVDKSITGLVEGTTNEAVKLNSALRELEQKRKKQ